MTKYWKGWTLPIVYPIKQIIRRICPPVFLQVSAPMDSGICICIGVHDIILSFICVFSIVTVIIAARHFPITP